MENMDRSCNVNGRGENAYKILIRILEGRRRLGRSRRKYNGSFFFFFSETGWRDVSCITSGSKYGPMAGCYY
jgi:hypothetical protein